MISYTLVGFAGHMCKYIIVFPPTACHKVLNILGLGVICHVSYSLRVFSGCFREQSVEICLGVNDVVLSTLFGRSEQMGDHATKHFKASGGTCGREAGFIFFTVAGTAR